jgi:error-prone DNA polymerase
VTVRSHPLSFRRPDLDDGGFMAAAGLRSTRDGCRVSVAGLVLVRQRPGLANEVTFIMLEDETEVVNLIVWPSLFERRRRLVLSAGMIGCRGKDQRGGEVIHLITEHLVDVTDLLNSVGSRAGLPPSARPGRRGEARRRSQSKGRTGAQGSGHLHPGPADRRRIKVRTSDFR